MTGRDLANAAGVVGAIAMAVIVANPGVETLPPPASPAGTSLAPVLDVRELADGSRALVDATGRAVPLRDYRKIVAGSIASRDLLRVLAEPDRLAGIVEYGLDTDPRAYHFAGIPRLASITEVEAVLLLAPDLVLVHGLRDPARVNRLREAGLEVFDLGQMRGLVDLVPSIYQIATLLGAPERGDVYARIFQRRMAAVKRGVRDGERRSAMYLSVFGDRIFGGTVGSSFHDVIVAAGLVDAAAGQYSGWPQYGAEDLLIIDPELVVTQLGMGERLCRQPELERLRACASGRRGIVEMPGALIMSPGPDMLLAAEVLHERVYGPR